MQAQSYDFTLSAGGSVRLDVVGTSFKLLSSRGPVQVLANTGARVLLMPGQGIRRFEFESLTIIDKSGAANVGQILITGSDDKNAEMIDDRITGEVSVIDGGKAKTLSGSAFMAYASQMTVGAARAYVQFFNPVGSGKVASVKSMLFSSNTAGFIGVGIYSIQSGVLVQQTKSKLAGGSDGVVQCRIDENAGFLFPSNLTGSNIVANGSQLIQFSEPIVIKPGTGVATCHNVSAAGVLLTVSSDVLEENE